MERATVYDKKFFELVDKLGTFDKELKTLYLRDDICNKNEDFVYLCTYYKFNFARSLWSPHS
jgi:hypothetical protein